MSSLAIRVENLTKTYPIRHVTQHARVTDAIASGVKGLFRRDEVEIFKALDDVSLEIGHGDVVGIIGRNGAGKSTLLKILSRITEPTSGRVKLYGKIGSLLEVGTGFHPELTGRENIFLNGAILGMRRREIESQFDAIVDFSEVERFLDTPVKRYSSGMYVRLAFAVAAHLNPDILIVDEVLAVGDGAFQKKCLGKMQDVSREQGRTVLFVSHNMAAIHQLCNRGVLLRNGKVQAAGACQDVVREYLDSGSEATAGSVELGEGSRGKLIAFNRAFASAGDGAAAGAFDVRHPITLTFHYTVQEYVTGIELSACVERMDGHPIFTSRLSEQGTDEDRTRRPGRYASSITIPGMFLMPDEYVVTFAAHMPMGEIFDEHRQSLRFSVEDTGTVHTGYHDNRGIAAVLVGLAWHTEAEAEHSAGAATNR